MYTLYDAEIMHRLTDVIELYFLEVPKFTKKPVKEMNRIEKWLAFLSKKLSKKEKEAVAVTKPAIQAAILDYNSGINAAREEGEKKMFQLMNALYKAGRQDDIAKLYADKTFHENLYKEFNII